MMADMDVSEFSSETLSGLWRKLLALHSSMCADMSESADATEKYTEALEMCELHPAVHVRVPARGITSRKAIN